MVAKPAYGFLLLLVLPSLKATSTTIVSRTIRLDYELLAAKAARPLWPRRRKTRRAKLSQAIARFELRDHTILYVITSLYMGAVLPSFILHQLDTLFDAVDEEQAPLAEERTVAADAIDQHVPSETPPVAETEPTSRRALAMRVRRVAGTLYAKIVALRPLVFAASLALLLKNTAGALRSAAADDDEFDDLEPQPAVHDEK